MSNKQHNIRPVVDVMFADGETRGIAPLTLRQLRKFVVALDKIQNTASADSMTDEDIDNMIEAASIILAKSDPILASDREALEDAIDLEVFGKLMNIAMGAASPEA